MEFKLVTKKPELKGGWAVGWYKNANDAWQNLYYGLNRDGEESSPRGQKIRETLGCNIYISDPTDNLVYNSFRLASPYYIAQEYFWYHSYDNNVESIAKYAGFWKRIANPDGTVNSNYGCYIFKPYEDGTSEWSRLVDLFKRDPDTRQGILQIPITPFKNTKDLTCTSSIQFFVRSGKVFMTVYMRSNDVNKGFVNDVPFFSSLQMDLANELSLDVGWYRHVVGSLHVYEPEFIENDPKHREFMFEEITGYDHPIPMSDYEILRNRSTEGITNPVILYMAKNFDNK